MAKTSKRAVSDNDDFFSQESAPDVGKRYEDREIDGWYEPEMNVIVTGILVGELIIQDEEDGPRRVALIELKRSIKAKIDEVPKTLEAGQVLAVGERAKLAPLFLHETGSKVWFKPVGQKKLSGKRKAMWQFEVVIDGKEKPPAAPAPF